MSVPTSTPTQAPVGRVISGAEFTQHGGCGDVFVWASTADDTMAITVEWGGAADEAWNNDRFDERAILPQQPVQVLLVSGRMLSATYCTDILMPGPRVDASVPAVSGTVELVVRPDPGGLRPGGHADLTLTDIAFELIHGTELELWVLDRLILQEVLVGWFAG